MSITPSPIALTRQHLVNTWVTVAQAAGTPTMAVIAVAAAAAVAVILPVILVTRIRIVIIVEEVTAIKIVTRMAGTAVIGATAEALLLQEQGATPLSIGVAGATPEALPEVAAQVVVAAAVLGTMMPRPLMPQRLLLMPLVGKGMGHA